jgi:2,3-bisphosphoglycerate-dependent phosphoglycerate mutase
VRPHCSSAEDGGRDLVPAAVCCVLGHHGGVSDLFCAATLVVARPGDAEYVDRGFSDEGGTLTAAGRAQAAALGASLAGRRIARVWCSDTSRAVQTAEVAAGVLGVGVVCRRGLREVDFGALLGRPLDSAAVGALTDRWDEGDLDAGFPGGESGRDVVGRYRDELAAITDEHRGETVLVVGHETAMCTAIPVLATNVRPPYHEARGQLRDGDPVELLIDADAWVLRR